MPYILPCGCLTLLPSTFCCTQPSRKPECTQATVSPGASVFQYPLQKHRLVCITNHCNALLSVNTSSITAAHLAHLLHLLPSSPFVGLVSQLFLKQSIVHFCAFLLATLTASSSTSRSAKSAKKSLAGSISPRTPSRSPSLRNSPTMTLLKASGNWPQKSILISRVLRAFSACWEPE